MPTADGRQLTVVCLHAEEIWLIPVFSQGGIVLFPLPTIIALGFLRHVDVVGFTGSHTMITLMFENSLRLVNTKLGVRILEVHTQEPHRRQQI